jgi:hypothetical protein
VVDAVVAVVAAVAAGPAGMVGTAADTAFRDAGGDLPALLALSVAAPGAAAGGDGIAVFAPDTRAGGVDTSDRDFVAPAPVAGTAGAAA